MLKNIFKKLKPLDYVVFGSAFMLIFSVFLLENTADAILALNNKEILSTWLQFFIELKPYGNMMGWVFTVSTICFCYSIALKVCD